MKKGELVTFLVDNPLGVILENGIKGKFGLIVYVDIYPDSDRIDYEIKLENGNSWWFIEEEFRPATDDECRKALIELIKNR